MELLSEQYTQPEPIRKEQVEISIINHVPHIESTDIDIKKIDLVKFSQMKDKFPNETDECIGIFVTNNSSNIKL